MARDGDYYLLGLAAGAVPVLLLVVGAWVVLAKTRVAMSVVAAGYLLSAGGVDGLVLAAS